MDKKVKDVTWRVFLDKFSSYEGTVIHFCKENNITKSQFYYHKRRFQESNKPTFYAIGLNKEESNAKTNNTLLCKDIRIEIGKANICIPVNEIENLSTAKLFFKLTGIKIGKCKNCERGILNRLKYRIIQICDIFFCAILKFMECFAESFEKLNLSISQDVMLL